jgi:hypothetical protein
LREVAVFDGAGHHFLTIVAGQEHLREVGVKTLWEGAQDVCFELIEGD